MFFFAFFTFFADEEAVDVLAVDVLAALLLRPLLGAEGKFFFFFGIFFGGILKLFYLYSFLNKRYLFSFLTPC